MENLFKYQFYTPFDRNHLVHIFILDACFIINYKKKNCFTFGNNKKINFNTQKE